MDELSADARRLIQRALSGEEGLSAKQRNDLWLGIEPRLVAPNGVTTDGAEAGLPASKALGPLVKGLAALGTIGALSWAGSSFWGQSSPPAPTPKAKATLQQAFTPSEPSPAPALAPVPTSRIESAEPNEAPRALPARPRAAKRPVDAGKKRLSEAKRPVEVPSVATAEASPSVAPEAVVLEERPVEPRVSAQESLRAELALLNRSYALIDAGKPARALALLGEHRQKYPNPVLAEEAQAAWAIAECRVAGNRDGGRARAEAFLARAKHSPLAERVRRACGRK